MSRPPRPSLRRQLQQSSLVAVLVGYGVLLVVVGVVLQQARMDRHRRGVELVREALVNLPESSSLATFQDKLERIVAPGRLLWLELESGRPYRKPLPDSYAPVSGSLAELLAVAQAMEHRSGEAVRSFEYRGRHYLCSSLQLAFASGPARLRVLEDVSEDQIRLQTVLLLLTASAGLSTLITSGLMRLALARGLGPLERLSEQLASFPVDRLAEQRLSPSGQPRELLPIVEAFNGLLDRLSAERQRQQAFVDGVAHELRTPITLISGYAQSLRRQFSQAGALPAPLPEPVLRIESEAARMGRLVGALLDIAREDAGQLELKQEPLDLDEALLEAYERLEPLAAGRLVLHSPLEGVEPVGRGDRERLQQCLTNLVENALKYTPVATPIDLFSSTTPSEVIAHVCDRGPGVPPDDRQRIFERFVRASSEASGSGIGLSVVKLLMERMGGSVRVGDGPEGGADFQLVLPRFRPPSRPLP